MKRIGLLALLLVGVTVASAGPRPTRVLGRFGIGLTLPRGWHGLAAPGQLQAADFPLGSRALASPERARVPRGHVHLIVWDYGPTVPYLVPNFPAARLPLRLGRENLSDGPLEGFTDRDTYAIRTLSVGEELIELVADLGPKPVTTASLRKVNRVLASLRVVPPRVIRPRHHRLAWGGMALDLLPGWSGRIEIPADRHAAELVLRARRGDVRVVLLELGNAAGIHADLPIALGAENILPEHRPRVARRVFSTAGRGFDLSVAFTSPGGLALANRLLKTLTAAPRAWTFRSCDLSLRLPGTWRAAINPRSGCYPVITLRGLGIRVVLTELRPREAGSGHVLRRSGRRFRVEVTPGSASRDANAVLATLRASPRR